MISVEIHGVVQEAQPGVLLVDLIERAGHTIPHVCYHPQLGPVQTCDTCMVEQNGRLIRACATIVADGMKIPTRSATASAAEVEALDRILSNHLLYCTVCDNNNGIFKAIPDGLAKTTSEPEKPIALLGLLRRLMTKDGLRGLAAATDFLQAFGRHLHSLESMNLKP